MQPPMMRAVRALLVAAAVAGLALDAWVHLSIAAVYDSVRSSPLRQGDLFRAEGAIAVLAAVVLLLRPSRRWTAGTAFVVAAGGLAAVLAYRYVDVGAVGPLPNMYEPLWYAQKTASAWSQAAAAAAALALLLLARFTSTSTPPAHVPRRVLTAEHDPAPPGEPEVPDSSPTDRPRLHAAPQPSPPEKRDGSS